MSMDVFDKRQDFIHPFGNILIDLEPNDLLSLLLDSFDHIDNLSVCNKPCGNNKGVDYT
jgi:hypothetical protein